jgi:hypothetical protein
MKVIDIKTGSCPLCKKSFLDRKGKLDTRKLDLEIKVKEDTLIVRCKNCYLLLNYTIWNRVYGEEKQECNQQ